MTFEHVQEIDAPASAVWGLTIDVERLPALTPTMETAKLLDAPLAVGSRIELTQPGDKPRTWTVEELVPEQRFVWSTKAVGTTMRAVHEIDARGDASCSNTLRIELAGFTAPLVKLLLAKKIRGNLEQENAGFARAATSA